MIRQVFQRLRQSLRHSKRRLALPGNGASAPVFIFSLHRSGGTLLMRLLNCHPDLVIWGEHGGIANQFAQMDEIIKLHEALNPLAGDERKLAAFAGHEGEDKDAFAPWAGPLNLETYHEAARQFFGGLFSRGLKPGQRWGFKEIRYHKLGTAAFLFELYPNARLILLQRELVDAAVSNILSPWSLDLVAKDHSEIGEATARAIIDDVAYGLLAFRQAFHDIAVQFPRRTIEIEYAALLHDGIDTIERIAAFLRLPGLPGVRDEWVETLARKRGETDKTAKPGEILNRAFIEQHLAAALPGLRRQFAEEGLRPLMGWPAPRQRRYAAMLGDHAVNGTPYMTVF